MANVNKMAVQTCEGYADCDSPATFTVVGDDPALKCFSCGYHLQAAVAKVDAPTAD